MNKLLHILLIAIFCVTYTGCSNDDEQADQTLKIVEANTIYAAVGGTGFIKLETIGAITATSDSEWCVPAVAGNTINLTVAPNKGLQGRTAAITIQGDGEKRIIAVTQTGAIMWFKDFKAETIAFLSEGTTVKTAIVSSYPISIDNKPDWLSYKIENDSLYLTVEASAPRKGVITFSSESGSVTYNIVQLSYAGLLGEYDMAFDNPSTGRRETRSVIFVEKQKDVSFTLDGLVITGTTVGKVEMKFSSATNNMTINAGQYLATIANSTGDFVYLSLRTAGGQYGYSADYQIAGIFNLDDNGKVTYTFRDNGTWPGQVAAGFGFYLFKLQPPTASGAATGSSYIRFMNIVMTKK